MMQIATLVVVSVMSVASLVLGVLSYLTVRRARDMVRDMIAFSRSLMSRFVASNNLQAEIYCKKVEDEEREVAERHNEDQRIEGASTVQRVTYLR